jgi:hypothetical protein
MSNETKLRLLLLALLTTGAALFFGIIYAFEKATWITLGVLLALFIWLLLISMWHPKRHPWSRIQQMLLKSFSYVKVLMDIAMFFIATVQVYLFCWIYVVAPVVILLTILKWAFPVISMKLIGFIVSSYSSIVMVNYTDFLRGKMLRKGVIGMWNKEESKKRVVEVGMYMLQSRNVHFIVLVLYVVFLVTIAFMQLQCNAPLITKGVDDAIWKSFLVFIAYTNMKKGYSETESDSIILLAKLLRMCHWLPKDMEKLLEMDNIDKEAGESVDAADAKKEIDAKWAI